MFEFELDDESDSAENIQKLLQNESTRTGIKLGEGVRYFQNLQDDESDSAEDIQELPENESPSPDIKPGEGVRYFQNLQKDRVVYDCNKAPPYPYYLDYQPGKADTKDLQSKPLNKPVTHHEKVSKKQNLELYTNLQPRSVSSIHEWASPKRSPYTPSPLAFMHEAKYKSPADFSATDYEEYIRKTHST